MRPDLEQAFIKKYVLKSKRKRYLGFIAKDKTRRGFLEMLYHGQDLDKNMLRELRGSHQQQVAEIRTKAASFKKGNQCYVISIDEQWDGKEMPTDEAIEKIVNNFTEATVLLFGDGAGLYYEGEPPYNYYVSL